MQRALAGVPASWRIYGEGAVTVLALHCALAHSGAWAGLASALPGVALTALDLLGHGRTADWDRVADYHATATAMTADLMAQLPGPRILIGHSLGGTIALRLALEQLGEVSHLVLIEPVLFCAASPEARAAYKAKHVPFDAALSRGPVEAATLFQAIWGNGQPFSAAPEPQKRYIAERIHLIEAPSPVLNDDAAGLLVPGWLEALAIPVLLLRGSESPPVVASISETLAHRLPDAREAVVAGAGHMLPITHAQACAAEIAAFLGL